MACSTYLADRAATIRFRLGRSLAIAVISFLLLTAGSAAADCSPRTGSASRWKLESRDAVSWLITPCGKRFFSIGINTLSDSPSPPLPSSGSVNLWPPTPRASDTWVNRTLKRVRAWGFNTAGAFSSTNLPLPGLPDLDLGWRAAFHWSDPFDPSVEQRMRIMAREAVAPYRGNAYRIGYFSDNEIGWWNGALFIYYLRQPEANHTKQKLIALIRRDYGGDWHRFTDDFVVAPGISSFQELLENRNARARIRPRGSGIRVVRDLSLIHI